MKKSNFKRISIIFLIAAALLSILYGTGIFDSFFNSGKGKHSYFYDYQMFHSMVQEGKIEKAEICGDEIRFKVRDDDFEPFIVENPHSPYLHEYLLLNGVVVKTEKSFDEILTAILDIVFYIFFFGALAFVFRKFISPNTFKVVRRTGVKFDDVIGMDGLKKDMKQILDIMAFPEKYRKLGLRMPKGIILEGAPGNGKTLFARAVAGEGNVRFIPAKATDFESMFIAIGPMKVKMLFRKARRMAPCIIFIDEFDGIGTKRNYSGSAIETENTRIVTALLNELDGFEPSDGVLVLAATNSISALDEALIRPGRFDVKFKVPFPDSDARIRLVQMYAGSKKRAQECTDEKLAGIFNGFSCAEIESALNKASLLSVQDGRSEFTLSDVQEAVRHLR